MSLKESKSKIVKHGDDLAILLPKSLVEGTLVQEGQEVTVSRETHNKFKAIIEDLVKDKIACQICSKGQGKYTCSICGIVACSHCFWEFGNLCKNCTKK
jgi:hypothetical protein